MSFQEAEFGYMWINFIEPSLGDPESAAYYWNVTLIIEEWTAQLGIKA